MKGASTRILADVTDAARPRTICTIVGPWTPQLVTQRMISWSATETPGQVGPSFLLSLDLFAGTDTMLVPGWQGGLTMDGLHSWSPDESSIAYITSDSSAVKLHVLSGGGDRVVTSYGAVPGRGTDPTEDDAFLGFSADGNYYAFVQTFTGSGAQLQIRRTKDSTLAYSQPTGTMATWASTGSRLYFREPQKTTIHVWDPTSGVATLFALQQAWIRPRSDAGDDNVAYTVRDTTGTPHVWVYGHDGRSGGELPNVRSSPVFLNTTTLFLVEEAPCGGNCGPGPPTVPDGNTFTTLLGSSTETPSGIGIALGSWPRIGQT